MPDTQKPDAAVTGQRWLRRRVNFWEDPPTGPRQIDLEAGPPTHWPGSASL